MTTLVGDEQHVSAQLQQRADEQHEVPAIDRQKIEQDGKLSPDEELAEKRRDDLVHPVAASGRSSTCCAMSAANRSFPLGARSEWLSRNAASGAAMTLPIRSSAFCTANRACVAGSASSPSIDETTSTDGCAAAHSAACARTAACASARSFCTSGSSTSSRERIRAPRSRRVHQRC